MSGAGLYRRGNEASRVRFNAITTVGTSRRCTWCRLCRHTRFGDRSIHAAAHDSVTHRVTWARLNAVGGHRPTDVKQKLYRFERQADLRISIPGGRVEDLTADAEYTAAPRLQAVQIAYAPAAQSPTAAPRSASTGSHAPRLPAETVSACDSQPLPSSLTSAEPAVPSTTPMAGQQSGSARVSRQLRG